MSPGGWGAVPRKLTRLESDTKSEWGALCHRTSLHPARKRQAARARKRLVEGRLEQTENALSTAIPDGSRWPRLLPSARRIGPGPWHIHQLTSRVPRGEQGKATQSAALVAGSISRGDHHERVDKACRLGLCVQMTHWRVRGLSFQCTNWVLRRLRIRGQSSTLTGHKSSSQRASTAEVLLD